MTLGTKIINDAPHEAVYVEDVKQSIKNILNWIDCPQVNECEDYQESYELLVKHLENLKQKIKKEIGDEILK